jgi:LacI family transcriptional regulator
MANIQDVAKLAGVSIATVSRVLNGTARVNSDVKARVDAAIQELRYQPSPAARSLRVNRSRMIGLLVSDIQNPFFIRLIQGVEDEAQRKGYSLILCNSDENPQKEQHYLDVLCAERVAGVIIVPTREQQRALKQFQEHEIPVVAVDRRVKDSSIDAVLIDNIRGAHEAVAHLIANGYRRIGAITGPMTVTTGWERIVGYRQALHEAGIAHDPVLEQSGPFRVESGRQLAKELLDLEDPIDALFVGSNLLTIGAIDSITTRNLRIPTDLAIVGYDELPWTSTGSISLTTVTQPVYELGSTAALRLFQRLQNPTQQARQEIILTPTLSISGSSRSREELSATGSAT